LIVPTYGIYDISNDFRGSDLSFVNKEENLDLAAEKIINTDKTFNKQAQI
jgi:hypothetical protein